MWLQPPGLPSRGGRWGQLVSVWLFCSCRICSYFIVQRWFCLFSGERVEKVPFQHQQGRWSLSQHQPGCWSLSQRSKDAGAYPSISRNTGAYPNARRLLEPIPAQQVIVKTASVLSLDYHWSTGSTQLVQFHSAFSMQISLCGNKLLTIFLILQFFDRSTQLHHNTSPYRSLWGTYALTHNN